MATKRTMTGVDNNNQRETAQTRMEEMSAIDFLEEDHRQVEDFFEEYEKLEDGSAKAGLEDLHGAPGSHSD
jgi:hypothetical protein